MDRTITIDILPDGKTVIEAHGFEGKGCLDATAYLETALGAPSADRVLKPEIRRQQERHTPNRLPNRNG
jgi:hypothetical protein